MPRQYRIFYKRLGSPKFTTLEPNVNAGLYQKADVIEAIEHMRLFPAVEGMVVRLEDELFNVIAFSQPAIAPNAFIFAGEPDGPPVPTPEPTITIVGGDIVPKTLA